MASSASTENNSVRLDPMGLAGLPQYIVLCNRYKDPNDPRNIGGPEGLPGQYKAVFVLNRSGFSLLQEYQCSFAGGLQGGSHLAITRPAFTNPNLPDADQIEIRAKNYHGNFVFIGYPNDKGFLGKVETEPITAENFKDALLKLYKVFSPVLSIISTYLDIPLQIYQIDVTELRTNNVQTSMTEPFADAPFVDVPFKSFSKESMRYSSLYREAMISNSPNYQFLCYYKIIEGLKKRHERVISEARRRGESITARQQQIIPQGTQEQTEWLNSIFPLQQKWDEMSLATLFPPKSLGKKIYYIVDNELDPIRNRIAHTILRSGEPNLSIDDGLDIAKVNEWLPLTKCIARFLLKSAFTDVFTK